jgi:hypothetical protein
MIPPALQVYSDQLASISEPLMQQCSQFSLPILSNAMRSFENVTRAFIVEVLKQKPALDQFDEWNSKCKHEERRSLSPAVLPW